MILPQQSLIGADRGRFAVRARYLFPGDAEPMLDGCLTVDDGQIVAVGPSSHTTVIDLGQVAILPGLINAHTHLEFSGLAAPLGTPEMAFPAWIQRVIRWRGEQRAAADGGDWWRQQAIKAGINESEAAGVTTLGEIATLPLHANRCYQHFRGVAFLELLGFGDEVHDALIEAAEQFVAAFRPTNVQAGLSPHAPYTVSPKLLQRVVTLSAAARLPVAMHLAETREELELLQAASGPLVDFLREFGAWQDGVIPPGSRPLDYLQLLAAAHRALVIHGNYLTSDEIQFVAGQRERMSVVYCPRTHAYFGHEPYPLAEMLQAGVRVAVGTDSRASNPDLNVMQELRFVSRRYPQLALAEVLRMATIDAAMALGVDDQLGSLTVGKQADFVVFPIGDARPRTPHELVLNSASTASAAFWFGIQVYPR